MLIIFLILDICCFSIQEKMISIHGTKIFLSHCLLPVVDIWVFFSIWKSRFAGSNPLTFMWNITMWIIFLHGSVPFPEVPGWVPKGPGMFLLMLWLLVNKVLFNSCLPASSAWVRAKKRRCVMLNWGGFCKQDRPSLLQRILPSREEILVLE